MMFLAQKNEFSLFHSAEGNDVLGSGESVQSFPIALKGMMFLAQENVFSLFP